MEKLLLVAVLLLLAFAGRTRGSFEGRGEWAMDASGKLGAVARVECADSGKWKLRLRGRVPGASEWWQVCITQDWRPCRA